MSDSPVTVVIGVIGADCHAVGNKLMHRILMDAGFEVVNLGVMVNPDEYVAAAVETDAKAVFVSSLYGHGEIDCRNLRDKFVEAGLDDILLYVGGNLVVGKKDFTEVETLFKSMGYDRVYPPGADLAGAIADLTHDLAAR